MKKRIWVTAILICLGGVITACGERKINFIAEEAGSTEAEKEYVHFLNEANHAGSPEEYEIMELVSDENKVMGSAISGNAEAVNTVSGNTVSGNTVSGNIISGNTVSGNIASGNTVSGNTASGNTVSGNTVSENGVSGKGETTENNALTENTGEENSDSGFGSVGDKASDKERQYSNGLLQFDLPAGWEPATDYSSFAYAPGGDPATAGCVINISMEYCGLDDIYRDILLSKEILTLGLKTILGEDARSLEISEYGETCIGDTMRLSFEFKGKKCICCINIQDGYFLGIMAMYEIDGNTDVIAVMETILKEGTLIEGNM